MGPVTKIRLLSRVLGSFVLVHVQLRRRPLPEAVRTLAVSPGASWEPVRPLRMSRIVHRTLGVGRWRPRCLIGALVLYRLLRAQGDDAELVIGLPTEPRDKEAHAWVEIDGVDVGPPPGKNGHEELARYP
jgi:hypothetical protein